MKKNFYYSLFVGFLLYDDKKFNHQTHHFNPSKVSRQHAERVAQVSSLLSACESLQFSVQPTHHCVGTVGEGGTAFAASQIRILLDAETLPEMLRYYGLISAIAHLFHEHLADYTSSVAQFDPVAPYRREIQRK